MKRALYFITTFIICTFLACSKNSETEASEIKELPNSEHDLEIKTSSKNDEIEREYYWIFKLTSIDSLTQILEKDSIYYSQRIGINGAYSEKYGAYMRLKQIASKDDLIALTKHKLPVVRAYVYEAIFEKGIKLSEEQEKTYDLDCSSMFSVSGCVSLPRTVNPNTSCYKSIFTEVK